VVAAALRRFFAAGVCGGVIPFQTFSINADDVPKEEPDGHGGHKQTNGQRLVELEGLSAIKGKGLRLLRVQEGEFPHFLLLRPVATITKREGMHHRGHYGGDLVIGEEVLVVHDFGKDGWGRETKHKGDPATVCDALLAAVYDAVKDERKSVGNHSAVNCVLVGAAMIWGCKRVADALDLSDEIRRNFEQAMTSLDAKRPLRRSVRRRGR
jgi:hypothetical protein